MSHVITDQNCRSAVFTWLQLQVELYGDVLPFGLLAKGFVYEGQHITIASQRGIWKPRVFNYPISIRTSLDNPYKDVKKTGVMTYKYFGHDPGHSDNAGLRSAMRDKVPLVYLSAVSRGRYKIDWPVFIVGDNPASCECTVVFDERQYAIKPVQESIEAQIRRRYITTEAQVRLHQTIFRELVLEAYQEHCAFCNLRHVELLDAAHIIPDREEEGIPHITNGLALCKIHHAAFDKNILGIRPSYQIEVREDILREKDGLMLQYGLQSLHQRDLLLPQKKKDYPDPILLEKRWSRFKRAS